MEAKVAEFIHHLLKSISPRARHWALAVLATVIQGCLFVGMQYYATGALAFPLDDSYIHLQYAKQIARGAYFVYQDGAPPTSGETSFLYAHLLAVGYGLGFREAGLLVWAHLIALISTAVIFVLLIELGKVLHSPRAGKWAAAMVWGSGALGWAFWSGMEIALFSALLLYVAYLLFQPSLDRGRLWIALGGLTLCRPEGAILATATAFLYGLFQWHKTKSVSQENKVSRVRWIHRWKLSRSLISSTPFLFFLLCLIVPSLIVRLNTGTTASSGMLAKSVFDDPILSGYEKLATLGENLVSIILFLLGQASVTPNAGEFVVPGLLLWAITGLIGLALRQDRESQQRALLVGLPLFLALFSVASLEVWSLHNYRYLLPFVPLLIFLGVVGVESLGHWIMRRDTILPSLALSLGALLVFPYLPVWAARYAQNATTIYEKQIQAARWMNRNLPSDHPIAINDAGALVFYGQKPVMDLVGLVTPDLAVPYRMGEGALYERLEAMPPDTRPQFAAVFPSWFEEMARTFDIFHEPLVTFPDPFDPGFGKTIYRVNWSYAGMEDRPRATTLRPGWVVKDALDIALLSSEQAHEYRFRLQGNRFPKRPIPFRRNFGYHEEIEKQWPDYRIPEERERKELIPLLKKQGLLNRYDIVDAGRRIDGEESFTLHNVTPGSDAYLILRTCDDTGKQKTFSYRMGVYLEDRFLGEWTVEGTSWNWYETVFTLPGSEIHSDAARIRIRNLGTPAFPYYASYYYWLCQAE